MAKPIADSRPTTDPGTDPGDGPMPERRPRHRQVVGIDGSPGSSHALRWALNRTDRFGPVEPVSAWRYPWWALVPSVAGTMVPPDNDEFQAVSERAADRMLAKVRRPTDCCFPPRVVRGAAGLALVSAAEDADLLVVGTRGRGAVVGGLLGSVSSHCVHHSPVPVAVIPARSPVDDVHDRVVVGLDGSENSLVALDWALANTPSTTCIEVVNAWRADTAVAEVAVIAGDLLERESEELLADAIAGVRDRPEAEGRRLVAHTRHGDPRLVLRDLAEDADLLIVGARGRGALAHLLLGSVASSVVHHPVTPTVVVR